MHYYSCNASLYPDLEWISKPYTAEDGKLKTEITEKTDVIFLRFSLLQQHKEKQQ